MVAVILVAVLGFGLAAGEENTKPEYHQSQQ